jgi:hypothetical protein
MPNLVPSLNEYYSVLKDSQLKMTGSILITAEMAAEGIRPSMMP